MVILGGCVFLISEVPLLAEDHSANYKPNTAHFKTHAPHYTHTKARMPHSTFHTPHLLRRRKRESSLSTTYWSETTLSS